MPEAASGINTTPWSLTSLPDNDELVKRTAAQYATERGPAGRDFVRSIFVQKVARAIRQGVASDHAQAPVQASETPVPVVQIPDERRRLLESGDVAGYLREVASTNLDVAEIEKEVRSIPRNPVLEHLKNRGVGLGVAIDTLLYPFRHKQRWEKDPAAP